MRAGSNTSPGQCHQAPHQQPVQLGVREVGGLIVQDVGVVDADNLLVVAGLACCIRHQAKTRDLSLRLLCASFNQKRIVFKETRFLGTCRRIIGRRGASFVASFTRNIL